MVPSLNQRGAKHGEVEVPHHPTAFQSSDSDGVLTAHPYLKGELLQGIVGKKGFPLGKAIMEKAAEGKIQSVTYWWPRPGTETPLEKHTFYTKVGDQICGVGYYKQ